MVKLRRHASARRAPEDLNRADHRLLPPRLLVLFLCGCLLFGYPALWPMSPRVRVAGIPILFVYLFVAWAAFIVALGWLIESATRPGRRVESQQHEEP